MKFVLAGDHDQYMRWLAEHGASPGEWKPVLRDMHLLGIVAEHVEDLVLVGTYWDNPAWGGETYRFLMGQGVRLGRPWARPWPVDWADADELRAEREGGGRRARERARARQDAVERLLGG